MKNLLYIILIYSLFSAYFSHATIYQCSENGVTSFSQSPCGKDAKLIGDSGSDDSEKSEVDTDVVQTCFSFLKKNKKWKDAESVRLEGHDFGWIEDESGLRRVLYLQINARNGYGGYDGTEEEKCYVNHSGTELSKIQYKMK
ncbi:hypothetical protein [uncultured Shewanella sp.]|uniref:hypothetical protein n=1 Tax=uncultured Shewanella sp. TaxID=173975 RepID=UPI0026387274|nr:hypothetical protein [uncultured Shewanella sp.]